MFASLNTFLTTPVGGGGPAYWMGVVSNSTNFIEARSIATDSLGNIYIVGTVQISSTYNYQLVKLNKFGVIQWQKSLGASSQTCFGYGITLDPSNNVYVCGYILSVNYAVGVVKYNGSGVLQWQVGLTPAGVGYSIAYDAYNSTLYCCGLEGSSSLLFQINSSGTVLWKKRYGNSGTGETTVFRSVTASTTGTSNTVGYYSSGTTNYVSFIQTDSSGNTQWSKYTLRSNHDQGNAVALDSANNFYLTGYSKFSTDDLYLAKANSSGILQWQRLLVSAPTIRNMYGQSIATDSSNNVYVLGYRTTGFGIPDTLVLAKYNSSGAIQWQRQITTSGTQIIGYGIKIDSSGDMCICGAVFPSSTSNIFLARLPADGSGTGTYTIGGYSYTYDASSYTDSSGSSGSATLSLPEFTSGLTVTTPTLTDTATTGTAVITPL
jgi:hypothetical protein